MFVSVMKCSPLGGFFKYIFIINNRVIFVLSLVAFTKQMKTRRERKVKLLQKVCDETHERVG